MPQSPSRGQLLAPPTRVINGKTYEFPAGTTTEEIDGFEQTIVQPSKGNTAALNTMKDFNPIKQQVTGTMGMAKRALETGLDLGKMVVGGSNPQLGMNLLNLETPDALQRQTPEGKIGAAGFDVGTVIIPAAKAASASNVGRNAAVRLWQRAAGRPVMEGAGIAENALGRGLGRLTRSNAQELANQGQRWTSQAVAEGVKRAEQNPMSLNPLTWLTKPGVQATGAQLLYNTAPTAQATAGGLGAFLLQRLLGGG